MNTIAAICDAVLENPQKIIVAGREFSVCPPKISTMIEASKYISTLPSIAIPDEKAEYHEKVIYALKNARNCEALADIAAILILGKKNLILKKYFVKINNQKRLAQCLMDELNSEELFKLTGAILGVQNVGFFLNTMELLNTVTIVE